MYSNPLDLFLTRIPAAARLLTAHLPKQLPCGAGRLSLPKS